MGDTPTCTTCSTYRPDSEPRLPHRPPVCDGDRRLLDRHLTDIANLVADLTNGEPPVVDDRRYERFTIRNGVPVSLGESWADPLAPVGGVSPINSRSTAPAVSGSRERPIPIPVAVVDLQAPARVPAPSQAAQRWPEDQVGYLSAATVLDQWVRWIRDALFPDHHLPPATVDELVSWLRHRVDDICDRHPAVADMADEVRHLRAALRHAAGETEQQPELCEGVACPRCDLRALMRMPADTYRAQCAGCGTLLTDDEYADVVAVQDATEREKRSPEEVRGLLRRV